MRSAAPSTVPPSRPARDARRFAESRRLAYQSVLAGAWAPAESALTALSDDARFSTQDWIALATTRYRLGRMTEMEAAAARALRDEPDNVRALHLFTLALVSQQRWQEALQIFEQHGRGPARQHYHFVLNHGTVLAQLSRPSEAMAVYLEAMVLNTADPAVHMKLGLALRDLKLYREAAESFTTASMLDNNRIAARLMALHMRQHACQWDRFEQDCAEVLAAVESVGPDVRSEGAVFSLIAIDHSPFLFKRANQQVALTCARGVEPLPRRPLPAEGERRLRIGYVSNDFHNHATALLFVEALEHRDRERFHVTLYSHSKDDNTRAEQRIRAACERYVDMRTLNEAQMARRIHADGVDLLVDLKGHTLGNRFGVFAHRPAPLQVSFLGFPGTTGADYIDYFIGDRWVTPLEHADRYTEKLAQLPNCYQPNDSRRQRPAPVSRQACGLPEDAFILGCFNQAFKLTPQTFDVWMRILKAVPDSLLWMLEDNDQATHNLLAHAQLRGVAPGRIVFAPRVAYAQHLARLPAADVMLDNWPCNAHTTASDALWMGVPVVTLSQEPFASRVAGSLLHAVGLGELVCADEAQYEKLVIDLARDRARLQAMRRHLEAGRPGFSLFDGRRFARDLEALYLRMVDIARRGEPPRELPAQG